MATKKGTSENFSVETLDELKQAWAKAREFDDNDVESFDDANQTPSTMLTASHSSTRARPCRMAR